MSNIIDMGLLSRKELYLAKMAGMDVVLPEPSTREEMFLAKMAGMDVPALEPSSKVEMLMRDATPASSGATPVIQALTVTENGTYTALDGVDGYSPVTVNVVSAGGGDGWEETLVAVIEHGGDKPITELPAGLTKIGDNGLSDLPMLQITSLPSGVTEIGAYAFRRSTGLALTSLPPNLTSIGNSAFNGCTNLAITHIPASVSSIGQSFLSGCTKVTEITFEGTPNTLDKYAFNSSSVKVINVPWAVGEVANAPWGATNATINYNYTGG